MNTNAIKNLLLVGGFLFVGLLLFVNTLTSGFNVVSGLYKYLPWIFFFLGFTAPKGGIFLMSFCVVGMGFLKKTMVLDGYFSFDSLYYVIGAPAILLLGCCLRIFLDAVFSREISRFQFYNFIFGVGVSLGLMAFILVRKGAPELAIMTGAYANIIWVLPMVFKDRESLFQLLFITMACMCLACGVGYYQGIFGLTELDQLYVELGYAGADEGAFIEHTGKDLRPFATYGSANAFGWSTVFGLMVSWSCFVRSQKNREGLVRGVFWLSVVVFLAGAVLITGKKAPIVGLIIFPFAVVAIRSWKVGLGAIFLLLATMVLLVVFGSEVREFCREASRELVKIHDGLTLNTINTRIKSFEVIADGQGIALFGPGDQSVYTHNMMSSLFLVLGWIPTFLLVVAGIFGYFYVQRKISRIVGSWKEPDAKFISYELAFTLTLTAGALMGTNAHQSFPVSYLWWLPVSYAAVRLRIIFAEREAELLSETATDVSGLMEQPTIIVAK